MEKNKEVEKAYDNSDFLHGRSARGLRVLAEFIEPEERLAKHGIQNTIVFFGSAMSVDTRTLESQALNTSVVQEKALNVSHAHEACIELARRITVWSQTIEEPTKRFYVCSGGGPGMMQAANEGAHLAGGDSIGFNISLPFEQFLNPHIPPALSFNFHYFFIRKFWFLYYAKAIVGFPGGFGTMDEVFEVLTLLQTHKIEKKVPVVLFDSTFWNEVVNFKALQEYGVISPVDLKLFKIIDDVDEAFEVITGQLTELYLQSSS
ncbi:MAG: LOG family protein [Phycisphaeraceae bacterium]|nr:LOG family protein [Phycisphaeraceae bacterium]